MEPENIDWDNLDSTFVEDNTYENFDAPKWVDLSATGDPVDDEAWFCNSDCKHRKTEEDFLKSKRNSKVKFLRYVTISEILPFKNMNRRGVRLKEGEINSSSAAKAPKAPNPESLKTKASKSSLNLREDSENKNPNLSLPPLNAKSASKKAAISKSSTENKKQLNEAPENSSRGDRKPQLRSTFSANNLLGGRDILNQITEICTELKRLAAKKSSKKGTSKERVRDRERLPLLVVKEGEV